MALDEKRLAGLGVAPQTIRSLPKFECPEPRQLDRLVLQNGLSDLLYHEIKSLANNLPGKIGPSSVAPGILDDVGSIQGTPPFFLCVFPAMNCGLISYPGQVYPWLHKIKTHTIRRSSFGHFMLVFEAKIWLYSHLSQALFVEAQ